MQVDLVVERTTSNKLNEDKLKEQMQGIAEAADKRQQSNGVRGKHGKLHGPDDVVDKQGRPAYHYLFKVRLEKARYRSEDAAKRCLEAAQKFVARAAEGRGWVCQGEAKSVEEAKAVADDRPNFVLPDLTPEVEVTYFGHIKERSAHIRLIYSSVRTFVDTERDERNHTLLYGDPASCKTTLIRAFKDWFEEADGIERIAFLNATTLSKAGLETWILDRAQSRTLPEILFINELEKGEAADFLCLLNIMDNQGEIVRLNARIGRQTGEAKILIFADCNDELKVKAWNRGALWSRFNKRWPCVRPSRAVMKEILVEMIRRRAAKGYKANEAWADAAIDYAFDKAHNNDPRFIKSLLDGGDDLLNGVYFGYIEQVQRAAADYETAKAMLTQAS